MLAHRIQVKFFFDGAKNVDAHAFVPIFHRWIRNQELDELLIDVADYTHVHEGPGIALIGHAADYYIDFAEGRPGLRYARKREAEGTFANRLLDAVRRALIACNAIEQDSALQGLRFTTHEFSLRIVDRLHAPNHPDTFESVRGDLEALLTKLYAGAKTHLELIDKPREPFAVRVAVDAKDTVATLLQRVGDFGNR